jgi:hypothetical protein
MTDRWRCWDGLMFGLAGSMMLWADLPAIAVLALLAALLGMALALRVAK